MTEDTEETAILQFMVEVYIPGHDGALAFPWAVKVDRSVKDVESVMDFAHMQMDDLMGSQYRMTIVDTRYNHHIIQWDKVGAVSILAPDSASLPWAEKEEDNG